MFTSGASVWSVGPAHSFIGLSKTRSDVLSVSAYQVKVKFSQQISYETPPIYCNLRLDILR